MTKTPTPAYDVDVLDPNPHCRSTLEREEWGSMGNKGEEDEDEVILLGTVRETGFTATNTLWFSTMVKEGTELTLERQTRDLLGPTTIQLSIKHSAIRLALVDPQLAKSVAQLLDDPHIRVRAIANPPTLRLDKSSKEVVSRIYTYDLEIYGPRALGRKTSMLFLYPLRAKRLDKFRRESIREQKKREERGEAGRERDEFVRWKGLSVAQRYEERKAGMEERRNLVRMKLEEEQAREEARLRRSKKNSKSGVKEKKEVQVQREWDVPPPTERFRPSRKLNKSRL